MTLTLFVPGRLENPLNGSLSRAHWSKKSRWSNEWKERTRAAWCMAKLPARLDLSAPKRLTFTAYVGAAWDENEGIAPACKPIRDALIGLAVSGDGPKDGHTFLYCQETNHRQRGVRVTVEALR